MKTITRILGIAFTFSALPLVKASFTDSDPKQPQQTQQVAQVQTKPPIGKQPNPGKIFSSPEEQIKSFKEAVERSKDIASCLKAIEKVNPAEAAEYIHNEPDLSKDYLGTLSTLLERIKTDKKTPATNKLKEKTEDALIELALAYPDPRRYSPDYGNSIRQNAGKLLCRSVRDSLADYVINKILTHKKYDLIDYIYPELALKTKIELTGKILKDASKTLADNSEEENALYRKSVGSYRILQNVSCDKEQKVILEKVKNEFKDLISASLDRILTAKDKEYDFNYGHLNFLDQQLIWFITNNSLPKDIVDKSWQPKLEKIASGVVDIFNKEISEGYHRYHSINALKRLSILELYGNEKSESKIYPKLLKMHRDGIENYTLASYLSNALLDVIYYEALMNHGTPSPNRVFKSNNPESKEKIVYLIPNESLIQPLEEIVTGILSKGYNSYDQAYHLASTLAAEPYCRSRVLLDALKVKNKKITTSKSAEILPLLENNMYELGRFNLIKPASEKGKTIKEQLVSASLRNVKTAIEIGVKELSVNTLPTFEEKVVSDCKRIGISEKHFDEIKATLRNSKNKLAQTSLDNLKDVKVAFSINRNTGEHTFDHNLFQTNINAFEVLLKDNPELAAKYFETIDNRLKTETDPRNRGMLYKALAIMSKGPKSSEVINKFTNAIITEPSLITTKMLGEALSGEFIRESTGKPSIKLEKHYRSFFLGAGAEYFNLGDDDTKNLIKGCLILNKNFRNSKYTFPEIELTEKEDERQILAFLAKVIRLQDKNNRGALEELLGSPLSIKDKAAVERVFKNTNSILGGFGNNLLQDTEKIFSACKSSIRTNNLFQTGEALAITLENIQRELELNIRYSPLSTDPVIAAAIVQLNYSKDIETFDKAASRLNESLFNGKKGFAKYKIYEGQLLNNCFNEYYESKKYKSDRDLSAREEYCKSLVTKLNSLLSAKKEDPESFPEIAKRVHHELLILNGKLYTEHVRVPLQELRIGFVKDFISLAPSGKRRDYLDIALNQFGLREYISNDEISKILSD